ncbi:MAG: zinc-ribbon domain-containing protein [Bryobacteraceae bacterium]
MPFCTHCGNRVGDADTFCARCGTRQQTAPRDVLAGVTPRTASILCYLPLVGWIPAIVVLAARRFRHDRAVRFDAFQGLYLFVAWLIVDNVIVPLTHMVPRVHIGDFLRLVMLGVWVFMIIKASQRQTVALPVIGELAERSLAERA